MKLNGRFVLNNVTIIDGKGNKPVAGKAITVKDGRILSICEADSFNECSELQVIDCSGRTIMPGMIDAHIHLFGAKENLDVELMTTDFTIQTLRSVGQARKVLKYGFTSLRDLTYNGLLLKRIFSAGDLIGPRIISSGPGLNHMACYSTCAAFERLEQIRFRNNWGLACYNEEDIYKAISIMFSEGADQIKVFANGSGCGLTDRITDQHFNLEELKYIVKQAKKIKGTKVIAHIFDNDTAWDCLEAGVDTFEHLGFLDERLCEEMVKKNIFLTPTATLLTVWSEEGMNFNLQNGFFSRDLYETEDSVGNFLEKCTRDFKLAHKKGVKIALGTDTIIDDMTPFGEFSTRELKTMTDLGMSPLETIHAATQVGSEVLGLEDRIGTIEEGKLADMLILKKNPAEDIEVLVDKNNIEYVLQEGKAVVNHGEIASE